MTDSVATELTLGEKQRLFPRLLAELTLWAYEQGYELSLGEAVRPEVQAEINAMGFDGRAKLAEFIDSLWPVLASKLRAVAGDGIRYTLHGLRLAQDYNLFKGGQFLTRAEDYQPIGEKWESMHPLCRWGGRFGDADHFSITHQGVK